MGMILAVSVGPVRVHEWQGRQVRTAIFKSPVKGPVMVHFDRLEGDGRGDLRSHGAPHNAVYAYAIEDLRWWSDQLGRTLEPGVMGENLTLDGVDLTHGLIGEQWRIGGALLEIAKHRSPCYKLGLRFGDPTFPRRFADARRLGVYLRVLEEGLVAAGDQVTRVPPPEGAATRSSRPGKGTR
jgi:MOSC domain-containing protein YiiM